MPPLNESDLSQFTGSEQLFDHWTRSLRYTDGVSHVAQHGGAYWLIDAIASYQSEPEVKIERSHRADLKARIIERYMDAEMDRAMNK